MDKKRILITGKNSYIGINFIKWVSQWPDKYETEAISVRNDDWKSHDFSMYDTVLHVAGIAHVSADPKLKELYFKVNRDLAINVAKKAKNDGAKQFIYMSSIIVYGADGKIGEKNIIKENTKPSPIDFYGQSKLEADLEIQKLKDKDFKIVIVRTPMVYGPNCKGNFPRLIKLAKFFPIFPSISNQRSIIYIDNLTEFLRIAINSEMSGIFFPQNKEYVSTKEIIDLMAKNMGKKVFFVSFFNPFLRLLSRRLNLINKVFGNKVYDKRLSPKEDYCIVDFNESIKKSLL